MSVERPRELDLHDVTDPIAFVGAIVNRMTPAGIDREECQAQALLELCELARIYRSDGKATFSTFAGWNLPRRINRWLEREKRRIDLTAPLPDDLGATTGSLG